MARIQEHSRRHCVPKYSTRNAADAGRDDPEIEQHSGSLDLIFCPVVSRPRREVRPFRTHKFLSCQSE